MTKTLKTFSLVAGALAMTLAAVPASAQFGGIRLGGSRDRDSDKKEDCRSSSNTGRNVASGILGGLARRATGGLSSYVPVEAFTDVLVTEIACQLDEKEQEKAAEATVEITKIETDEEGNEKKPEVGRSAEWTSDTRDGVSGKSTITAVDDPGEGAGDDCITVTDVIIVDGEETRADKRMCRLAGSPRYTIRA